MEENRINKGDCDDNFDEILKMTSKLKVPTSNQSKEAAWEQLFNSIQADVAIEPKVIPFYTSQKLWFSVAATLLVLFIVTSLTYRFTTVEVQLSKGETAKEFLPDSSEVMLNAESRIEYRRFGWISNRELSLSGEAFFNVKKGSQFTVVTDFNRKIIVTGTKFNVVARGDQFEVKCFDGSVNVQTSISNTITLIEGNGIVINKKDEFPTQIKLDSIPEPSWIKGEYYFSNTPLNLVMDELSRQFNITIKSDGVDPSARYYSGFFKHTRLVEALDLVCIPMNLTYHISSDSTIVTIKK